MSRKLIEICKYIEVHDEEENLKQSVGVLLFVDKHKDGAKMDVVSNHLPGNCSNRNFFSKISCYWKQGGNLPRAIWGTFHLLRQPRHVVQSRYSPLIDVQWVSHEMKMLYEMSSTLSDSRIRTHHAPSANLNFNRFYENPPEKDSWDWAQRIRGFRKTILYLASASIALGKVAENMTVCRSGRQLSSTRITLIGQLAISPENILWIPTRTWGSKPISNILSASSRIIMVIRRRLVT